MTALYNLAFMHGLHTSVTVKARMVFFSAFDIILRDLNIARDQ